MITEIAADATPSILRDYVVGIESKVYKEYVDYDTTIDMCRGFVYDTTEDGERPMFVGRAGMTQYLADIAIPTPYWEAENLETLVRLGFIGKFYGSRVRVLANYRDELGDVIPFNVLYVVSSSGRLVVKHTDLRFNG